MAGLASAPSSATARLRAAAPRVPGGPNPACALPLPPPAGSLRPAARSGAAGGLGQALPTPPPPRGARRGAPSHTQDLGAPGRYVELKSAPRGRGKAWGPHAERWGGSSQGRKDVGGVPASAASARPAPRPPHPAVPGVAASSSAAETLRGRRAAHGAAGAASLPRPSSWAPEPPVRAAPPAPGPASSACRPLPPPGREAAPATGEARPRGGRHAPRRSPRPAWVLGPPPGAEVVAEVVTEAAPSFLSAELEARWFEEMDTGLTPRRVALYAWLRRRSRASAGREPAPESRRQRAVQVARPRRGRTA